MQSPFQIAEIADIPLIVAGRSGKPDIKELSIEYISAHIREFVFYTLDGERAGLMRLFTPPSCPEVIEMGSFVKLFEKKGVCTALTNEVERIGESLRKTVIAITIPGGKLANHLEREKWELCTESPKYTARTQESPGKAIWQKVPKISK